MFGEGSTSIIWLHGLSETPENWEAFGKRMQLKNVQWVMPADQNLDWFNDMDKSVARIKGIVEREVKKGQRVIVGGFSQGAALAPRVALLCKDLIRNSMFPLSCKSLKPGVFGELTFTTK
mgnify:CR=1 FL=1